MLHKINLETLSSMLRPVTIRSNVTRFVAQEIYISQISSDTRTLNSGDVFIALSGPNFDGNAFVQNAIDKGAKVIIASAIDEKIEIPYFVVSSTLLALKLIACYVRSGSEAQYIAVTGSVGKTTTKEMIKLFLSAYAPTGGTNMSLNNHIGVPFTILEIDELCKYAVIELGMNHFGEIAYLTDIVKPNIAVITSVHMNHIEFFGDEDKIASAKSEIFIGMTRDSTAIINRDCKFYGFLANQAKWRGIKRVLSYGKHESADIKLAEYADNIKVSVCGKIITYDMPNVGYQLALNSLASIATAVSLGLDPAIGAYKMSEFQLPSGKGNIVNLIISNNRHITIIDESYNSGPEALKANLERLRTLKANRYVAILADINELGSHSQEIHVSLGPYLSWLDSIVTIGKFMHKADPRCINYDCTELLIKDIENLLQNGDAILLKGSHTWQLTRVLSHIKALYI